MESPHVVYVGEFRFPDKEASATRVLGIGKALREAGYRVLFAGVENRGRAEDLQPDGTYGYQGFTYVPEEDLGDGRFARLRRGFLTHLSGETTMRRLHSLDLAATRAMIAYNATSPLLMRLRSFCRKRGIALAADCTEWYDPRHVLGGRLGPIRWDNELRMRWMQPKVGNVIAISSFLEQYYRGRGCNVLRVPPLVDMEEPRRQLTDRRAYYDGVLRLVYAGSAGKKDLLAPAICGLGKLGATAALVELHLLGPSPAEVRDCMQGDSAILAKLGQAVVCHGQVAHSAALEVVRQSDFSILMRPDARFAHAGFPTKLVESLSLGVPVITSLTGDIGTYVRQDKEGIVLEGITAEAFAAGVRRALAMPESQRAAMRVNARQQAAACFDYRRYVARLGDFVRAAVAAGAKQSPTRPRT